MSESSTETNVNSPDASWGLLCMCCDKQAPTEICMEVVPTASWGRCGKKRKKKKPARACNVKYTRQAFLHQFLPVCFLAFGILCWAAGSSAILCHKNPKFFQKDVQNRSIFMICGGLGLLFALSWLPWAFLRRLCASNKFYVFYRNIFPNGHLLTSIVE